MSSPRRRLLLLPAALGAFALAGCGLQDDGPSTSQTRDVGDFTRIDNRGSVDVRLRAGATQRVQVRAGEKVIDDVRTDVRDGTLQLTFDHDGFGGSDVVVEIAVPRLTGIAASGSGDIDADGIDADAFEVRSDGSADITLAGHGATAHGRTQRLGRRRSRRPHGTRGACSHARIGRRRRARRRAPRRHGQRVRGCPLPRRSGADAARQRVGRPQAPELDLAASYAGARVRDPDRA